MNMTIVPTGVVDYGNFSDVAIDVSDYTNLKRLGTALRFGRFEYKYIIPDNAREVLEAIVSRFMELDANCADTATRSYTVTSVYFDTPALDCYHEKQDGLLYRRKFRMRSYSQGDAFLEEKGRRNAYSYKKRVPLPARLVKAALSGQWRALLHSEEAPNEEPFSAFVSSGLRTRLAPKARVTYQRRAYVSRGGYRFRVTLDDRVTGADAHQLHQAGARVRSALPGQTIVEIKFESQLPLWFLRQIQCVQLTRTSISKYCICAEALGIVQADEPSRNVQQLNYFRG